MIMFQEIAIIKISKQNPMILISFFSLDLCFNFYPMNPKQWRIQDLRVGGSHFYERKNRSPFRQGSRARLKHRDSFGKEKYKK